MKNAFLVVILVSLTIGLAGCHEPEPGTGDDNLPTDPDPEVTSIAVTRAPDTAAPGEWAIVCWELEGHGTVPHTAVHFDNESHANGEPFNVYDAGASYPGNETAQDSAGYTVPRSYCTSIPVGNETVYWRAHVIVAAAPGMLSEEQTIAVVAG